MAWFFSDSVSVPHHIITGEDARHISRSLRMKAGEMLTVCDKDGVRHDCTIENISDSAVEVSVDSSRPCENEPKIKVVLYQALTKGEKMEMIIQKSVELGVSAIVPVLTARCVSRPDEKSANKKRERWNKIALAAAMQSRRGIIPQVRPFMNFSDAAQQAGDTAVVCYELGGVPFSRASQLEKGEVSLFIGSEGGFEQSEIDELTRRGGTAVTLGKRILRAETAPLAALSVIMYLTGDLGSDESAKKD
ncbi:MAG: 16S rRNA (uracil(1498)-N(3))-methyltransferase [Clostridia bacterium]|nr:16S rRNA (uracil(1498)-N(3))-methyltransferase [Clostridia bacterium]